MAEETNIFDPVSSQYVMPSEHQIKVDDSTNKLGVLTKPQIVDLYNKFGIENQNKENKICELETALSEKLEELLDSNRNIAELKEQVQTTSQKLKECQEQLLLKTNELQAVKTDSQTIEEIFKTQKYVIENMRETIERKNSVIRKFSIATKNLLSVSHEVISILGGKRSLNKKASKKRKVRSSQLIKEVIDIAEGVRVMVSSK